MDQHDLTRNCLAHLAASTVHPESLTVYIFDNASREPFALDQTYGFEVISFRNEVNQGYYLPLLSVAAFATEADIVGLIHNDLYITEPAWDDRLRHSFIRNPRTGLIGLLGSNEVDHLGGRGGGTMGNFKGDVGQKMENTGERLYDYRPALVLDSLAMFFRKPVIQYLNIDEHVAPCHFYDKIWSLRTMQASYDVGVLGIECEHIGGQTAVGNADYRTHALAWCEKEGISPDPDPETAVYLAAERVWLHEGRVSGLIPTNPAATTRV